MFLNLRLSIIDFNIFVKLFINIIISAAILFLLFKLKIFNDKNSKIIFLLLIIFGIIVRLYYICNLNIILESDFKFYFDSATSILYNDGKLESSYLSYNGYAYVFASIIAFLRSIFGDSIKVILFFNLICQLVTIILMYNLIKHKSNKITAVLLSSLWFLFPNNIFANLLVSTETLFMMLYIGALLLFYCKIEGIKEIKKTNILYLVLFGILLSIINYIRPVMLIFILALIIYNILNNSKLKHYISLIIIIITYSVINLIFNSYVELGIGQKTRPGALEWSIYFGANNNYCGSWSLEDSKRLPEILEKDNGAKILLNEAVNRYKIMGAAKAFKLVKCKFNSLWVDNYSMYYFVLPFLTNDTSRILTNNFNIINYLSLLIVVVLCFASVISTVDKFRNNKYDFLFVEIFAIGYILSNLIVCLNGRYNYPLLPLLIIISINFFNKISNKNNIKIINKQISLKKNPKVLLIIPAYNEEENIEKTVNRIKNYKVKYDFIIINDGSKDKTKEICEKNKYPHINLINNLGIGGAVQTGYKYSLENDYDVAVQFDGDGQHDVTYVEELLKPMYSGIDFTIGSRFVEGSKSEFKSSTSRRVGIKVISFVIKVFSGKKLKDTTSGFRAANKNIIKLFAEAYPVEFPEPISFIEATKKGFSYKEVPVKMHERTHGVSSIKNWKSVYYMINVCLSIFITILRREK